MSKKVEIEYDSNPFTVSFKGLGLLVDHAKGVFYAMLAFGLLGFFGNFFPGDEIETSEEFVTSTEVSSTSIEIGEVLAVAGLIAFIVIVMFFIVTLITAAVKGVVSAGAVAASEKRTITFGQTISEMSDRYGTLLKAEIITALKIIGGYLLLIVPGVRAQMRYQSTSFIIMRHKTISASEAIQKSKELYSGHLMEAFGIATVGALVPVIGGALGASGMAMSVRQLEHYAAEKKETPDTHWLNYLGFLLFIALFGFLALLIFVFSALD